MFCSRCGSEIQHDHAFCHACGAPLVPTRRWTPERRGAPGMLRVAGQSDVRFFVFAVGGLLGVLLLAEVVKAVVLVTLPLLVALAIIYYARQRRRRYY